jgi:hypothetical protein
LISLILNVVLTGAPMASHESDQIEVPPNHAMEDANWVHERSSVQTPHVIMPRVHISITHYGIHLQLVFDYDSH